LLEAQAGAPDAALTAARKARQYAPDQPAVADTLGWLLLQNGAVNEALPLLQQAHDQPPSNDPAIAFHLASAYARSGDRAKALALLTPLIAAPPFAEQTQAQALLRSFAAGK
jgi:predicted Zn-dependent protease